MSAYGVEMYLVIATGGANSRDPLQAIQGANGQLPVQLSAVSWTGHEENQWC